MKEFRIYKIENLINGKLYIGKTCNKLHIRFKDHIKKASLHENRYLYDAMNHYGYDNFRISEIEIVRDEDSLNDREIFWISKLDTLIPNGYNMTKGGDGGNTLRFWKDEDRKKLYKQQTLKRMEKGGHSNETKEKIRKSSIGRRLSSETKEKIRQTNILRGTKPPEYTLWVKGQKSPMQGRIHSSESRDKISKARNGKTYEELMGEEKAQNLKSIQREKFITNNPNSVIFPKEKKLQALEFLLSKIKVTDISKEVGFSVGQIVKILRKFGIKNVQKEKRLDSWEEKIERIINAIKSE